ncbi:MAG: preprotein translocase subunit SecE [Planctomycetales bacterium]|nr:preprotein translocase subunit SecE [Planctomycetales bacterium]
MNVTIYKRGQGKNTRLWAAIAVLGTAAIGCWRLHLKLGVYDNVWLHTLTPAVVLGICAALIYWLSNLPSVADFLIAAEGEIKKVSWSSRKEIANSTMIVIFVVIVVAVGLGLVDLGFQVFFRQIVNLY